MYSSAIRPKCLEGIRILRTNLVQIQALTALSCARWARQLHLSMPKTPQVLRNNSYGKVITMEKMFSRIVKIGGGKLHRFKLQCYLDDSVSTDSRLFLCVVFNRHIFLSFKEERKKLPKKKKSLPLLKKEQQPDITVHLMLLPLCSRLKAGKAC